jgi:hypothetical protein
VAGLVCKRLRAAQTMVCRKGEAEMQSLLTIRVDEDCYHARMPLSLHMTGARPALEKCRIITEKIAFPRPLTPVQDVLHPAEETGKKKYFLLMHFG